MSGSVRLTTPLGADALSVQAIDGEEFVSEPFLFQVTASARDPALNPVPAIGKAGCVTLTDGEGKPRFIHGQITRFSHGASGCVLDLRPWLWLLGLSSDNRIFQNQSVPDILAKVFAGYVGAAFRNDLVLVYEKQDYRVQYAETDFAFASRLMQEAGIAYYFEHKADGHTLVMVDDPAKFPACANIGSLPFVPVGQGRDWVSDHRIETVAFTRQIAAGAYQVTDYDFTAPSTSLLASAEGAAGTGAVYEYPGDYLAKPDGETIAKRRIEELAARAAELSGASPVRHLMAGATFTLSNHANAALNAKYILLSVRHHAARGEYANDFVAVPADVAFRPARTTPRPRIAGSQTAIVVGPQGKEIWTDQYGRIKVQFHWDREGKNDDASSCWIRVAQNWSGPGWGAFTLPRIGQEVVVSFLEGDPDRPLVTGCVYNGTNATPYALPEQQTRSTLKSQSSPDAKGFNEIRFEDKAGSEELFIQAQKDLTLTVLNNVTETVTQDRSVTVQKGDALFTVSKGNLTQEVGGNVGETTKGDQTLTVSGNLTINVTGNVTIKANGAIDLEATGALTLKGATVAITASASGSFDGGGMLALKGGLVKLN